MCIETRLAYMECRCTLTIHMVCHRHVKHTHKQLDSEPCPYHKVRGVVALGRGCKGVPPGRCHKLHSNEYTFEVERGVTAEDQWTKYWEDQGREDQLGEDTDRKFQYTVEEDNDEDDIDEDEGEREEFVKKLKLGGDVNGKEKSKLEGDVDMDIDKEQGLFKKQKVEVKKGNKVNA